MVSVLMEGAVQWVSQGYVDLPIPNAICKLKK